MSHSGHQPSRRGVVALVLRLLVVAGLAVDVYVHLHLAGLYQQGHPGTLGEGNLFRLEAVIAAAVGLAVLFVPRRPVLLLAALVGLGGAALVVLYRYVQVPALGPLPSMYEPIWFTEKTLSAVAEAVAGLLALVLWWWARPLPESPRGT